MENRIEGAHESVSLSNQRPRQIVMKSQHSQHSMKMSTHLFHSRIHSCSCCYCHVLEQHCTLIGQSSFCVNILILYEKVKFQLMVLIQSFDWQPCCWAEHSSSLQDSQSSGSSMIADSRNMDFQIAMKIMSSQEKEIL